MWVAKDDGSDLVRAAAIVSVGIDYNGNITARIGPGDGMIVTLADRGRQRGEHPADDFHRQPSGRAGRTLLISELVSTDVVAFETQPSLSGGFS